MAAIRTTLAILPLLAVTVASQAYAQASSFDRERGLNTGTSTLAAPSVSGVSTPGAAGTTNTPPPQHFNGIRATMGQGSATALPVPTPPQTAPDAAAGSGSSFGTSNSFQRERGAGAAGTSATVPNAANIGVAPRVESRTQ